MLVQEIQTQALLEAIINTAVDGILTINERGIIQLVNPAAARLFGYTAEELTGSSIEKLMPQPHRDEHQDYIERYQDTGRARIIGIGREVMGQKKDGTLFPFKLAISEVETIGTGKCFTGIIHDLTHQKKAEADLKRNAIELERVVNQRTEELNTALRSLERANLELTKTLEKERELNELKSRFVALASHEFRTPLSTILSSVSLIDKYQAVEDVDKRTRHVGRIKSAVQNLTGILNDFLSLEKIEGGMVKPELAPVEMFTLGGQITDEMQEVAKNGQKVIYNHTGDRAPMLLDRQLIKNIVINLVSNAIKYSDENKEIWFSSKQMPGHLILTVKDQGMGIPNQDQERLFDRFHRATNATHIQGTGLGLHIVKKYVDLLNGTINFVSEENVGTVFMVALPVKSA